jgi:hypothetical protein
MRVRITDIDSLCFYGGIHIKLWEYHRLLSKHFPFAIYYSVVEDTVLVMAVLDCRRNPSWIRTKLMTL